MIGVYPGSFDPLTVAHLAIAEAAATQLGLERVDLVLSQRPLGKHTFHAPVDERLAILGRAAATRSWLRARVTDDALLADIAAGYDVLVLGADKWAQVRDVAFYRDASARDDALARLPRLAVASRGLHALPHDAFVLELPEWVAGVSSSAVRAGRTEWLAPEAGVSRA